MTKNKFLVPALAFGADVGLAYYTYAIFTNYEQFQKIASMTSSDPAFLLELYQVFTQTLSFVLLLLLTIHLFIYIFYMRGNNFAFKYVRFYLIIALLSLILSMIFSFNIYFLLGTLAYGASFYFLKLRNNKST